MEHRCFDPLNGWLGGYCCWFPFVLFPLPIPRTLLMFEAGGVVVMGPLSVDDDEAFEGEGDWSLIWCSVTIGPLPLPNELNGLPGPLFIDWIGEKVFVPAVDGVGDVLWLLKLWLMLLLLLLLLLFVLLLLLLQFSSEISGFRSGGDNGAMCWINAGSRPVTVGKKTIC
jgi:hypothetical protein